MKRAWQFFLLMLILSVYVSAQAGQQEAAMAAHPKEVEQGKQITFAVTVSPTPNVSGAVRVTAVPENGTGPSLVAANTVGPDSPSAEMGSNIPTNAKLGKWKVVSVTFEPPNSPLVQLTVAGNPTFEVVERKAVLPRSADVKVK